MQFELSEEQVMVRDSARGFLASKAGVEDKLAAESSADGFDRQVWQEFANLGWLSFAAARDEDEIAYLGILCEEIGRASFASPFLSCAGAASLLSLIGGANDLIEEIASGNRIAGVLSQNQAAKLRFENGKLSGGPVLVEWGTVLDTLIIPFDVGNNFQLAVIDLSDGSVTKQHAETFDNARAALISFDGVTIADNEVLSTSQSAFTAAVARSQLLLAAEAMGGAFGALDLTVEYVRERHQFGHPIGAFQAVRHGLADVRGLAEGAWLAVWSGLTATQDDPSVEAKSAVAVWAAKRAFQESALKGSQYHGGMGHVVDGHMQFFYRRAGTFHARVANDWALLGTIADHFVAPYFEPRTIGVAG